MSHHPAVDRVRAEAREHGAVSVRAIVDALEAMSQDMTGIGESHALVAELALKVIKQASFQHGNEDACIDIDNGEIDAERRYAVELRYAERVPTTAHGVFARNAADAFDRVQREHARVLEGRTIIEAHVKEIGR